MKEFRYFWCLIIGRFLLTSKPFVFHYRVVLILGCLVALETHHITYFVAIHTYSTASELGNKFIPAWISAEIVIFLICDIDIHRGTTNKDELRPIQTNSTEGTIVWWFKVARLYFEFRAIWRLANQFQSSPNFLRELCLVKRILLVDLVATAVIVENFQPLSFSSPSVPIEVLIQSWNLGRSAREYYVWDGVTRTVIILLRR